MSNMIGIDVSEHNGYLDWQSIKAAGIQFAILRGGYGRYAVDSQFLRNLQGARDTGIPVGVYWFSYAITADGARQEALKCAETLKEYDIQLPVFYDFEYDTVRYAKEQGVSLGKQQYNAFATAFLEEIRTLGYQPGIYYNLDYFRNMVDIHQLGNYITWYAQYASAPSISDYAIWQYTSSGKLSGLSGSFDLNELKDTSLLAPPPEKTGWQQDHIGWRYIHADGSYSKDEWEKIDGQWYRFDKEGYRMSNVWTVTDGNNYYLDADGTIVTDQMLKLDETGKLVPAGAYYNEVGNVPKIYRDTVDKLIANGILKGREGTGENLVLDMSEDVVRLLVILDRADIFTKTDT